MRITKTESLIDLDRQDQHTQSDAEIAYIRKRLIKAEQSGFIDKTPNEILAGFKERLIKTQEKIAMFAKQHDEGKVIDYMDAFLKLEKKIAKKYPNSRIQER